MNKNAPPNKIFLNINVNQVHGGQKINSANWVAFVLEIIIQENTAVINQKMWAVFLQKHPTRIRFKCHLKFLPTPQPQNQPHAILALILKQFGWLKTTKTVQHRIFVFQDATRVSTGPRTSTANTVVSVLEMAIQVIIAVKDQVRRPQNQALRAVLALILKLNGWLKTTKTVLHRI